MYPLFVQRSNGQKEIRKSMKQRRRKVSYPLSKATNKMKKKSLWRSRRRPKSQSFKPHLHLLDLYRSRIVPVHRDMKAEVISVQIIYTKNPSANGALIKYV